MLILKIFVVLVAVYFLLTIYLTYLVHQIPRRPIVDTPDWGHVTDARIPAAGGAFLEVWRVEPDGPSKGIILLAHGWSRNRDRMVFRARIFACLGFTTVMHSARDHGKSSPKRMMNAKLFAEDIEAVLNWVDEPVLLYGHSAGSAGAAIAASQNPDKIRLLFLEASYADTKESLQSLYRWVNPIFGRFFAPMVLIWMDAYYGFKLDTFSPSRLATDIKAPVMLIHGSDDDRFPISFAKRLKDSFRPGQAVLYIGIGAGHSDSSHTPGYADAVKNFLEKHAYGASLPGDKTA
jgi:uncharacterized protein